MIESATRATPVTDEDRVAGVVCLDPGLWSAFRDAETTEAYAAAWLELQCRMIPDVVGAVVVLASPATGRFVPLAYWPETRTAAPSLSSVAEKAMAEARGVVRPHERARGAAPQSRPNCDLAYPLLVDDVVRGVVAMEIRGRGQSELQAVLRQLQWGSAWLELRVRREEARSAAAPKEQLVAALDMVAVALEHAAFHGAATSVATELATRLGCERVSIGLRHGSHVRVRALSHSAEFGKDTNLVRAIGAAMDEALDQDSTVVYPSDGAAVLVTRLHEDFARVHGAGAVCTVPVVNEGRLVGAMTFELAPPKRFDDRSVELCEAVAALVGPILDVKWRAEHWLSDWLSQSPKRHLVRLLGPEHATAKLVVLGIAALIAVAVIAKGDYRVSAHATLEGSVQRAVVAPLAGYIAEASGRAGDIVEAGDVLCALDDKDLQVERLKWASQEEQLTREYREALAADKRAQVSILKAQIEQAKAQLALVDEQLRRTRIVAPFAGVVVSGDLSQALGAPVERGQVLFEVAPLDSYRIILKVEESDIDEIAVGQRGRIALSAMPQSGLGFVVERITPVSTAEEGRNIFRVEAALSEPSELLRPGMQGVGKIEVDRRRLAWIWTHALTDWVRLRAWQWLP